MPKLVTGMQNKHGFTLIEILVVLVIIGITISFALLAFGDFGSQRRTMMAAEQFVNYVKLVQQQAILESSTLGIRFNQANYQVLHFKVPSTWQPMPQKNIFHQQHFPDNTLIRLESERNKGSSPQIIIYSSGDMTPFVLHVGSNKQADIVNVVGRRDGTVFLQLLKSS